jgi:hypothetical protein
MADVAAAGAVTVAACATAAAAAVLALTSSSDEARSGGATVAEATDDAVLQPAPSRECAVCLSKLPAGAAEERSGPDEPAAVRALPACGHAFHADCIGRWLPLRPECPLCRRPVLLAGGQEAAATPAAALATAAAPAWARPARIACVFGDGRVLWTRSPSASQ